MKTNRVKQIIKHERKKNCNVADKKNRITTETGRTIKKKAAATENNTNLSRMKSEYEKKKSRQLKNSWTFIYNTRKNETTNAHARWQQARLSIVNGLSESRRDGAGISKLWLDAENINNLGNKIQ